MHKSPVIVIVDDDESIRAMFNFFAQGEGWTVFGYDYAGATLAALQQVSPNLIILDFAAERMGEAWELLQLLKMEESTAAIPVIVSTATRTLPADIRGYLASREVMVVAQPFDVEDFIGIVRQILFRQNALLPSEAKLLPILLVEDNQDISDEVLLILEMEGYLATSVPNGKMALEAVRNGRHSLIFLDLHMPVMSGHEFLAAYALQPGPQTPVVIFSAQADLLIDILPSFVISRLSKPFTIAQVLKLVREFAVLT